MYSRRGILTAAISIGLIVWFTEAKSQRKLRNPGGRNYGIAVYIQRRNEFRLRKFHNERYREAVAELQNSLWVDEAEAGGVLGWLSFNYSMKEPLVEALGSSYKNHDLSAVLGATGALLHDRADKEQVSGGGKFGKKVNIILNSVLLAAKDETPSREYMTGFLDRLYHALRTDNSRGIENILGEFARELTDAERDTEDAGGNCCAEKNCKCKIRQIR